MISTLHCCSSIKVVTRGYGQAIRTSTLPRDMGVERFVHLHSHRLLARTLYGFASLELGRAKLKDTTRNQGNPISRNVFKIV